ncbi:helix-turn-helix domain-containing protein [Streptomyces eurythermus]|uniref:helix-turn-helix domain-containing protein n=1 Tax=Streptomyces eurythermus TaxID=42237 RepID=UPI0036D3D03D
MQDLRYPGNLRDSGDSSRPRALVASVQATSGKTRQLRGLRDKVEWMSATARTVADNVRRLRTARGMSLRALAAELKEIGHPLSADALNKIENGRTPAHGTEEPKQVRRVDVDDLTALAQALRVSPMSLLLPWTETPNAPTEVTGAGTVEARAAWEWASGQRPVTVWNEDDHYGELLRFRVDSTPAWARTPIDNIYNEQLTEAVTRLAKFKGQGRVEFDREAISVYDTDGRLLQRTELTVKQTRAEE